MQNQTRIALTLSTIAIIVAAAGVAWINTTLMDVQSNLRKNIDAMSGDVSSLKTSVSSMSSDVKIIVQQVQEEATKPKGVFELDMSNVIEAAKKEGTVVWWGNHDVGLMAATKEAFETKYPFLQLVFARLSTRDLSEKSLAEYRVGKYTFDVLSGGRGGVLPIILQKDMMLQRFPDWFINALKVDGWIQGIYDNEGYYVGRNILFMGVSYNTQKVKPEELPKTWMDLTDPKWKGRMATDSPARGGVATNMFGELKAILGEEKWLTLLKGIAAQQPVSIGSSGTLLKSVVSGEYDIGVGCYLGETLANAAIGAPVAWVKLEPVIASPSIFLLAQKAPHSNAAILFIDWAITDGQKLFEKLEGNTPANPLIKSPMAIGINPYLTDVKLSIMQNDEYWKDNTSYLLLFKDIFGKYA